MTLSSTDLLFVPCEDVAVLLNAVLDAYERRSPALRTGGARESPGKAARPIHILLGELDLPGYFSQVDPNFRRIANSQLQALQCAGWLRLIWQPGEGGHLLRAISMPPESAPEIFRRLNRTPQADHRARLAELIRAERFRFPDGWRRSALQRILNQLKDQKSPTPFNLTDSQFNQDLLSVLVALDDIEPETPYRVFSVRLFNNSKRFDDLKNALVRLARSGQPAWRAMDGAEVLRELHLVPNPGYLYLSGPWRLVDERGQVISLSQFSPAVGFPAAQAARLQEARIAQASQVIFIENPTAYYQFLYRGAFPAQNPGAPLAALCLWGNPSPACRHLISCLIKTLLSDTPLRVWADMDYGGFNILAQLREQISPRFEPYLMGVDALEAHASWAHPLTRADERNLRRISRRPSLSDVRPVIDHMLRRGLKLEQEAIRLQGELPTLST